MSSKVKNALWLALVIAGIALKFYLENQPPDRQPPHPPQPEVSKSQPAAKSKQPPSEEKKNGFTILRGARLAEHRDNDGDSFHIRHDGKEHELRLYFADCPEKRLHQHNGDRIRQQGRYFGGLSVEETIGLGLKAKEMTQRLLSSKPFTVQTRWQPVYDSGRFYAFVFVEEGGRTEELSEKLVRAGLARIHTGGASLPDGRSEKSFEQHLRALEREAKAGKLGGWSD